MSEVTAKPALDGDERQMIDELKERLRKEFGDNLVAIWLFGSRARGERHADSDIDLLVLVKRDDRESHATVMGASTEIELAHGRYGLAPHVRDLDWLDERREIRSFFVQEIDRDKVVLHGRDL